MKARKNDPEQHRALVNVVVKEQNIVSGVDRTLSDAVDLPR